MIKIASTIVRFSTWKLPPVNHRPEPYTGPAYEQVFQDRKAYMPNFHFHHYKEPLLITQGWMQYLYDHKGNRYLDMISGLATVNCGHCHPAITKVVRQQAGTLVHSSSIFLNHWQGQYCRLLAQFVGPDYDSVYLCNSGGEANDFAVYISRLFTEEHKFLSLQNSYHGVVGNSYTATSASTWKGPMMQGSNYHYLPWPSRYHSQYKTADDYLEGVKQAIRKEIPNGRLSGVIFEPIQGVGGVTTYHEGYIKKITDYIRQEYGALIIADEVQTGFGRIGPQLWGHRWQGVKPDIVTMAKVIGNGVPLAAVVTSKKVTNKLSQLFFNTYGGGPIQCRVGMEVLRIIQEDKLAYNAETVGSFLLTELQKIADKHPHVGDVRGKGLMIGIELVKDKETKEPLKDATIKLMELFKERGIVLGKGGVNGNVLRFYPPLCLTLEDAKHALWTLEDSLQHIKA